MEATLAHLQHDYEELQGDFLNVTYCIILHVCFGVHKHYSFPFFMLPDTGKLGDKRFEYINVSLQVGT